MHTKTLSNISAMTLIEVVIAILIFGIWISSIYQAIAQSTSSMYHSQQKMQAILLAKEAIDIVRYNQKRAIQEGIGRDCLVWKKEQWSTNCSQKILSNNQLIHRIIITYPTVEEYTISAWEQSYLSIKTDDNQTAITTVSPNDASFRRIIEFSEHDSYVWYTDRIIALKVTVSYGNNFQFQEEIHTMVTKNQ